MKTIQVTKRKPHVKNIVDKAVDKDLQSMLFPLNLMQYVMFCPKYSIENNIITPNGLIITFVSMIATLTFILLFFYRTVMLIFYRDFIGKTEFLYVTSLYDTFFYCSGFIINFVFGVIHTKKSVDFVLTFQKVHRFLTSEASFNRFIVWNWVTVIVALTGHSSIFTVFCRLVDLPYVSVFLCHLVVVFDFHIIYAFRGVQLLKNKVIVWSMQIQHTNVEDWTKMFQVYVDILECYKIHQECFQYFVSI